VTGQYIIYQIMKLTSELACSSKHIGTEAWNYHLENLLHLWEF